MITVVHVLISLRFFKSNVKPMKKKQYFRIKARDLYSYFLPDQNFHPISVRLILFFLCVQVICEIFEYLWTQTENEVEFQYSSKQFLDNS